MRQPGRPLAVPRDVIPSCLRALTIARFRWRFIAAPYCPTETVDHSSEASAKLGKALCPRDEHDYRENNQKLSDSQTEHAPLLRDSVAFSQVMHKAAPSSLTTTPTYQALGTGGLQPFGGRFLMLAEAQGRQLLCSASGDQQHLLPLVGKGGCRRGGQRGLAHAALTGEEHLPGGFKKDPGAENARAASTELVSHAAKRLQLRRCVALNPGGGRQPPVDPQRFAEEEAGEARIRPTARDREIMGLLGQCRYMSTAQGRRLCFLGRYVQRGERRLQELSATRGNEKPFLRKLRYRTVDSQLVTVWGLTERGYAVAEAVLDSELKVPRHEVGEQFLEHAVHTSDLFVGLVERLTPTGRAATAKRSEFTWRSSESAGAFSSNAKWAPTRCFPTRKEPRREKFATTRASLWTRRREESRPRFARRPSRTGTRRRCCFW